MEDRLVVMGTYVFDVIVARTVCPPFSEQIWPKSHCINE